MAQENQDGGLIRRYLLGRLPEDEREHLEERMMADNEFFNTVLLAEDDLVEEYVQDDLPESEQAEFEASFLSTPEGRQQVAYAKARDAYVHDLSPAPVEDVEDMGKKPVKTVKGVPSEQRENQFEVEPSKPDQPGPVWWRRPAVVTYLAAAAVIVIALGLGIWPIIFPSAVSKGLTALAYAYRDQRPLEARISGFNYAPASTTRGGEPKVDKVALNRASGILHDAEYDHPDAASHHALGRLYLAEKKFDDAIAQFEAALKEEPNNAQLHSDYGAALLELDGNNQERQPGSSQKNLAAALEQFDRALELKPSLLEALFNKALCHQSMKLPRVAEDDWREYLQKDDHSTWAEEAKQNLKVLEDQRNRSAQCEEDLFRDFLSAYHSGDNAQARAAFGRGYTRTGNIITNRLIDDRLSVDAKEKTGEAADSLLLLSYVGSLFSHNGDDRGIAHLAQFYVSTSVSQRMVLAQARGLAKRGDEQSRESHYQEASHLYSRAKDLFDELGDRCEARYVEYRIDHCRLRSGEAQASLDSLEPLSNACKGDRHQWLLAFIYNSIADAYSGLGEYSKALDYSCRALKTSEEIQDINGIARCCLQVAIGYEKVNDNKRCITNLERAMQTVGCATDLSLQWIIYDVAAEAYRSLNLYAAAIDYQVEAAKLAVEMDAPLNVSRSFAHLGFMYGKVGRFDQGLDLAGRAYDIGRTLTDEPLGREMMAYASLYLGDLHRLKGDYEQAVSFYNQNIDIYGRLGFPLHRYAAHKGKFLCFDAQSDEASAKTELETTLNLFEQYRSKILEDSNRNSFFDLEQNVYDAAIDFEYSRAHNSDAAFEKSEASRARSLLDLSESDMRVVDRRFGPELLASSYAEPIPSSRIAFNLPKQSQIVQYAELDDKLLIWVLTGARLLPAVLVRVGRVDLTDKIDRFVRNVSHSSGDLGEINSSAKELYALLISPVEGFLDKNKYLCIIPDKALNRLPFCALVSPSDRYLIQDYFIGNCPSSTIFIKRSEVAQTKEGVKEERAVVVGNPSFDHQAFSSLQDLPSSAIEAEGVAALYNTSPLSGSGAKKTVLMRELVNSDVIHLSTHYVADGSSYLLSSFLLAPEKGSRSASPGDGRLQVREIYQVNLSRPRFAVLAACTTGVEKTYEGEGAINVARAFLAAGVPLVVGSLWSVDSKSTSILMINFHRHRKRDNHSTSEALCLAQREMITGDPLYRHPYYWASFTVVGGYSRY